MVSIVFISVFFCFWMSCFIFDSYRVVCSLKKLCLSIFERANLHYYPTINISLEKGLKTTLSFITITSGRMYCCHCNRSIWYHHVTSRECSVQKDMQCPHFTSRENSSALIQSHNLVCSKLQTGAPVAFIQQQFSSYHSCINACSIFKRWIEQMFQFQI